jgi:hypothetical protein
MRTDYLESCAPDAITVQSYTQPHLANLYKLSRFICTSPLISFYTDHGSAQKNKIEFSILKVSIHPEDSF